MSQQVHSGRWSARPLLRWWLMLLGMVIVPTAFYDLGWRLAGDIASVAMIIIGLGLAVSILVPGFRMTTTPADAQPMSQQVHSDGWSARPLFWWVVALALISLPTVLYDLGLDLAGGIATVAAIFVGLGIGVSVLVSGYRTRRSADGIATTLGIEKTIVRRWMYGRDPGQPIPTTLEALVTELATFAEAAGYRREDILARSDPARWPGPKSTAPSDSGDHEAD